MADLEHEVWSVVQKALLGGIEKRLETNYSNPLDEIVDGVILKHSDKITATINGLLIEAIRSDTFKASAREYLAHKVAKSLMGKLEGAIDKCANTLRSDPAMRARLLLAIEKIVKDHKPQA